MSNPILTVTPNPSIDKTAVVSDFQAGAIHRPERMIALAGGKGLNVARAIHRLGGEVHACTLLAGHAGHWIADQLEREGIPLSAAWGKGETRTCLSIVDPDTHLLTEVYEQGPSVDLAIWERFESAVEAALASAGLATLSGSLPLGTPADGYARLMRLAGARSIPVLIDTHGASLRMALSARPQLVKINADEAGEWMGQSVASPTEAAEAARRIREAGASSVVVTLGKAGAVAIHGEEVWQVVPPSTEAASPVGSGDALLGGLALALWRGEAFPDALRLGAAAGTANALTLGAGVIQEQTVAQLMTQVTLRRWAGGDQR